MLFNSYEFILVFLPATVCVFYWLSARVSAGTAITWLVVASLFFYGWWNPIYLGLLLPSIAVNFLLGRILTTDRRAVQKTAVLSVGLIFNLGLIAYFKYAGFLVGAVDSDLAGRWSLDSIVLPLGISFFTFQQISFLVDCRRGLGRESSLRDYTLFVCFFPQLIAGPIVHHSEMMPQFKALNPFGAIGRNIAVGLTIFAIGLFKKAVIADGIATSATPIFAAAEAGAQPAFFQAWSGALAYALQLYFDFSGYCDMAIGAARMFGIRLPLNFHSPYKATSIIEFWRRWHMTLSRFLRDYVYISLGGNRRGRVRRYVNLLLTMLIGGLWHGAGWTFIVWGGLHGGYLIINHAWRHVRRLYIPTNLSPAICACGHWLSWLITFFAVVLAFVIFRAESLEGGMAIVKGMVGLHGVTVPAAIGLALRSAGLDLGIFGIGFEAGGGAAFVRAYIWIAVLLLLTLAAPNTQEIVRRYRPALFVGDQLASFVQWPVSAPAWLVWRPAPGAILIVGIILAGGLLALPQVSEFLYFQF